MLTCPHVRRIRIFDGRGCLVLGRQPITNEQYVDARVLADDLAQVAVRFVAAFDEATAVVVDEQRRPVIARRADVNRRNITAGPRHRHVGQCDIGIHPGKLRRSEIQPRYGRLPHPR